MIAILGPTATGKTRLAALVAAHVDGEVISADSRQVYRGMDLGTGKDIVDYLVDGKTVPYHLIDIVDPGYEYNVYEYQRDFSASYRDIVSRGKIPVLCGGTGMYLEAVLKGYTLQYVPENRQLRDELEKLSNEELIYLLSSYKPLHNVSDISDHTRMVRAIEIQAFNRLHPELATSAAVDQQLVFGILLDRAAIRERITERLKTRLQNGMVEEVQRLLAGGLTPYQLKFYGLEYKFITRFIQDEINHQQMFQLLNIAIHQFAKRQMTWFRRMERAGMQIHWIDGNLPEKEKLKIILDRVNKFV